MLLENKNAVVYGAGRAVGTELPARSRARGTSRLHSVGRTPETWRAPTEEAKPFGDLQEFHDLLEGGTLLRRLPTLDEGGNVAALSRPIGRAR
jgi:hypothetical protein